VIYLVIYLTVLLIIGYAFAYYLGNLPDYMDEEYTVYVVLSIVFWPAAICSIIIWLPCLFMYRLGKSRQKTPK
jgi:hypothetical protein